ncbi:MAG TPA: hypothetical protein VH249_12455 [Xanthobacteraceae bacterium]|nr:hypothetical protein [Xanthobacteraceae bacterium]
MAEQTNVVETIARQLVEHCRRDIEAAALAIAGARAILESSRWLLARWEERRRADAATGGLRLPAYDDARAGMFLSVAPEEPRRRGRKRRAS